MSLVKKHEFFEKPGVGIIIFQFTRFPFRIFTRKVSVLFKPDFPNAALYKLNPELVDLEEFMAVEDAYKAMAYLRSVDDNLTPMPSVLKLVSP